MPWTIVSVFATKVEENVKLKRHQRCYLDENIRRKNIDADDLLVSGDLSTLGNLYTQQEKKNFVLSQVGLDVIAPSMAKDADAHTSVLSKFPSQRRQLINLSNK
ncbi:hypothetical protein Tco_1498754 [Tanacetum coccineum]